jgi:hypothetical protein
MSLFFAVATVITQQTSLSYVNKIMTKELSRLLKETSAMTLFLPINEAWEDLDPVEKKYLESEFASDDLHRILELHAVAQEGVVWSQSFEEDLNRKPPARSPNSYRFKYIFSDNLEWPEIAHTNKLRNNKCFFGRTGAA